MQEKGMTLALAESMTCGFASHKLNNIKGTSDVFKGSIVCYSPEVKKSLLKVPQKMIDRYTCESQQVTDALAKNLHRIIPADVCAVITGLASPGGSETQSKPVGTVFISVFHEGKLRRLRHRFYGSPLQIKLKACEKLFELILETIQA